MSMDAFELAACQHDRPGEGETDTYTDDSNRAAISQLYALLS